MDICTLTKDDIKAMRNADYIVFSRKDGQDNIICGKEESDEFGDKRRERVVNVHGWITDYERNGQIDQKTAYCFHMLHSSKYHTIWQSIASLMQVGDGISLRWTRSNNSEFLQKREIVMDMLDIEIVKAKGKSITFHVHTSVVGNLCSFRMVRERAY